MSVRAAERCGGCGGSGCVVRAVRGDVEAAVRAARDELHRACVEAWGSVPYDVHIWEDYVRMSVHWEARSAGGARMTLEKSMADLSYRRFEVPCRECAGFGSRRGAMVGLAAYCGHPGAALAATGEFEPHRPGAGIATWFSGLRRWRLLRAEVAALGLLTREAGQEGWEHLLAVSRREEPGTGIVGALCDDNASALELHSVLNDLLCGDVDFGAVRAGMVEWALA